MKVAILTPVIVCSIFSTATAVAQAKIQIKGKETFQLETLLSKNVFSSITASDTAKGPTFPPKPTPPDGPIVTKEPVDRESRREQQDKSRDGKSKLPSRTEGPERVLSPSRGGGRD